MDVVYTGQGECSAIAYGRDEWWEVVRRWEVECGGPEGKVLGRVNSQVVTTME